MGLVSFSLTASTYIKHSFPSLISPNFNGAHFAHGDSKDLARCIRGWIGTVRDRQVIRNRSYDVVERFYNPTNQAALIERALDGKMADDSAWQEYCGKGSDPGL